MESLFAARGAALSLAVLASACGCNGDKSSNEHADEPTNKANERTSVAAGSGGAGPIWLGGPGGLGPRAAAVGGATCVPAESDSVPIPLIGQQSSALCWAGVTEMIAMALGKTAPQCDQVMKRLTSCTSCSGCPGSKDLEEGDCNTIKWPNFPLAGLHATNTPLTALPLAQLQSEISCFRRPVAFSWNLGGEAGGHIMVAYGYVGDTIMVADPSPECVGQPHDYPYSVYDQGEFPGVTFHLYDFYEIWPLSE